MHSSLEAIRTAFQNGNAGLALYLAKDHLRQDKDDGRAWELLGLIQNARGRARAVVFALERATILVPLSPAARVCLALCYAKTGRTELAKDLLKDLIFQKSLNVPLLLQVATGLDALDQPGWAMRACREASRRDPEHAQPYYDLGYYAARCGQPAHFTESLARKAISLDPENVCFRVGLASLLMKQDRNEDGYQVIRRLSKAQIQKIDCKCCLERIVDLYESAGDYRRLVLCRQHLLSLELSQNESDCG